VIKQIEIEVKYSGYIKREQERIGASKNHENQLIPPGFDYDSIQSMRHEAREKLKKILPENLGQASRISGVNPSDISILSMYLKRCK
jgi:tRNA uridine 5-carboxymethylaminomethyl modification enzyme